MKISTRVKGMIAAIYIIGTAAVINAVISNYKLEKELEALKIAVEVEEIPAAIPTSGFKEVKKNVITPSAVSVKPKEPESGFNEEEIPKIAPVQFIAHEEIPLASEIQEHIESECERLEVDPAYIYALIESESSFRTGLCVEDGGGHSAGLCQINSVNWPAMYKLGLDPMNELDNITYCITLVKSYWDKYPTVDHVTTCYKAGEGGAKRLDYHLSVCDEINSRTEYYNEILKGGK